MNYRPRGHMQKQFSSISETVQSSQNSSNSCTVQSLQYRFNTKLMSVRQIWHPRPSSRTRSAHIEQNRWCPHGTSAIRGLRGAIRHTSQLSLSVSGVSTWLSVWLSMSTTSAWSASSSSTSELSSSASHTLSAMVAETSNKFSHAYSCRHQQATVLVPARMKARVDITWTVLQHEYTRSRDSIVLTNSNKHRLAS